MEEIYNILSQKALDKFEKQMRETKQSPKYHGEGDVYTHTMMVCDSLKSLPEYQELSELQQQILYVAAMLHDIDKINTTVFQDGDWHSPNHAIKGSKMARELMFVDFGIGGDSKLIEFRETVCLLIRHHSFPPHAIENEWKDSVLKMHRIASNSKLLPDFSIKMLCILAKADAIGKISDDTSKILEDIEMCAELAKEENCYEKCYDFPSDYTMRAYLSGKDVWKSTELYNDTWGSVIVMSGLPGVGKDTFIQNYFSVLPMVSLDEIRKENKISPTDNQGVVANIARNQAKEYLRNHKQFVWNATNLTPQMRDSVVNLIESYNANANIVYVESSFERILKQNSQRKEVVPTNVIESMVKKLIPPMAYESKQVNWVGNG